MFATGKITSIGARSEKTARQGLKVTVQELERILGVKMTLQPITTENVVAVCDLGQPIDLERFTLYGHNALYEPEQFSGVILRVKKKLAVHIFATGKMTTAGSKSEDEARSAIRHVYGILANSGCLPLRKQYHHLDNYGFR
jgi:transcription initiation factor TFIID TATA-box-binding protein